MLSAIGVQTSLVNCPTGIRKAAFSFYAGKYVIRQTNTEVDIIPNYLDRSYFEMQIKANEFTKND